VIDGDPRRGALQGRASGGRQQAAAAPALSAPSRQEPALTSSNARHLPTLRRRKDEPVAAQSRKAFKTPGMRQKNTTCDRGHQQAGISGHASAQVRRLRYRSAPMSCICRILDLETGNSDILQRSVVDRLPGRSDTADLAFAEHSRPQLGKDRSDRGDPGAPASENGWRGIGTPDGGAILGRTAAAGVLARPPPEFPVQRSGGQGKAPEYVVDQ